MRRPLQFGRETWQAWVALMDRREAPTAQALTRMLVAAVILFDLLSAAYLEVVTGVWAPPPYGLGAGAVWTPNKPFMVEWLGPSVKTAWIVWTAAVVSGVMLLCGAASRISAVALALALAQLGHMAPDGDRGIDYVLRAVLVVLAVSSCHARWSVDAWLWRKVGRPMPAEVPAWPRYLLFAQLIWIYFSAGHNRSDPAWGPLGGFEALSVILSDPHFARFDPGWVPVLFPLLQLATLGTMMFELSSVGMPLFTRWDRHPERAGRLGRLTRRLRLRWVWIATGVFFHLGIAATMRLGIFPFGVLALYPVLFHPDELARAGAWLRRRLRRGGAAGVGAAGGAALLLLAATGLGACGGGTLAAPADPPGAAGHTHGPAEGPGPGADACGHGQHRFENPEEWAARFDHPDRDLWQKPDEVVRLLELAPGMTVVDVGAGTGYFLAPLSRAVGATGRVLGTDIEPGMVRYMKERAAREELGNVEAVLAPTDDVGVPAGTADRILLVDVWHHIDGREAYASRLARALRPGGSILIIDFTLETERGPPPRHRVAPDRVIAELEAGGLSAELIAETLPDQYAVRARHR
jgi:uncharacterized membrane protein YphA (DoxX/SURF4 family)/predicted O-methyltransferase YrrM